MSSEKLDILNRIFPLEQCIFAIGNEFVRDGSHRHDPRDTLLEYRRITAEVIRASESNTVSTTDQTEELINVA